MTIHLKTYLTHARVVLNDEIIEDGKTGILTKVGSAKAIASAAIKILTDDTLQKQMAVAAKERTRRLFDTSVLVKKWENLITEVAEAYLKHTA